MNFQSKEENMFVKADIIKNAADSKKGTRVDLLNFLQLNFRKKNFVN